MPSVKAELEQLTEERATLLDKSKEILAQAKESDDGLTDEQEGVLAKAKDRVEAIDERLTELHEQETQQATLIADMEKAIKSKPPAANRQRQPEAPEKPHKPNQFATIPATVRRYGQLKNFVGDDGGLRADERAYRFGQYALAKLSVDLPGKYHFAHALAFARDQFGFQPQAVHSEGGTDTTGAHYFVPDEFGMDLIRLREMYGVARNVLRVVPMGSDTKSEPRWVSGLTAYFTAENDAYTESETQYDSVSLTAKKLTALTRISKELDEDSVINFGDQLAGEISYAFANKEDQCAFNGDGTSTYGKMTGIRNRLDTLTAGTAPGLIQGAGNAWSELTLPNFESVVGALPQYADVPGQVYWICHKTFAWTVMKRLALAAGGNTADDITNGPGMSFLGYPVRVSQVFPSTEANSQIPVVFGNFSLCGMFGDRRRDSIEFSDQATVGGQSVWERDQIAVKGSERFDINIHDYGTNSTAGPIVGLETAAG